MFYNKHFILLFIFLNLVSGAASNFIDQMFLSPFIDTSESENVFICPTDKYYEKRIFSSFFSQIGTFTPATGLIFTITIYGATSAFSYLTTCLIDDVVFFTVTLLPIFSWFTLSKPIWLYTLITTTDIGNIPIIDGTTDIGNIPIIDGTSDIGNKLTYDIDGSLIIIIASVSSLFIIFIMAYIKYIFHMRYNHDDKVRFERFFFGLKTFVIWTFLFHSIQIIVFSIVQYIYIFSKVLSRMEREQLNNGISSTKTASTLNLLFLPYIANLLYFITAFFLVILYHHPNLFLRNRRRNYQGFVAKKIFFLTITLCIIHIFFEYFWFCTPPFLSTFFNTVIIVILTRSIKSFFSEDNIERVHRHNGNDKIFAQIKHEDIGKVKTFYAKLEPFHTEAPHTGSPHNVPLRTKPSYTKYRVIPVNGHICVFGSKKYFFVVHFNNSVYFRELEGVSNQNEIQDKIIRLIGVNKECLIHNCENVERNIQQEFINRETTYEITDHVLINLSRTGILNFIVYSHRCSNRTNNHRNSQVAADSALVAIDS